MLVVHGLLQREPAEALDLDDLGARLGARVGVVTHGGIAALVSDTDEATPAPSRRHLVTHAGILEAAADLATVLPVRFGVVAPDEQALVGAFLAPEEPALLGRIVQLDGHAELRMRGSYDEDIVVREVLADDRRAARLRGRQALDARLELGERITAGIEARRDRDAGHVVAALRSLVSDVAPGAVSEPLDAFALSFLVSTEGLTAFDRAVEELGAELAPRVQLELVGPLPPFSFAVAGA